MFHLATYHGNQSSIADPLADHANNLITTLKLFEHLKEFRRLDWLGFTSLARQKTEFRLDRVRLRREPNRP